METVIDLSLLCGGCGDNLEFSVQADPRGTIILTVPICSQCLEGNARAVREEVEEERKIEIMESKL